MLFYYTSTATQQRDEDILYKKKKKNFGSINLIWVTQSVEASFALDPHLNIYLNRTKTSVEKIVMNSFNRWNNYSKQNLSSVLIHTSLTKTVNLFWLIFYGFHWCVSRSGVNTATVLNCHACVHLTDVSLNNAVSAHCGLDNRLWAFNIKWSLSHYHLNCYKMID